MMREGGHPQALVVEENDAYRAAMAACAELAGCFVEPARTLEEALRALQARRFDVLIWAPARGSPQPAGDAVAALRAQSDAPLLVVDEAADSAQLTLEAGADQWLPMPFIPGLGGVSVRTALRHSCNPQATLAERREIRGVVVDGSQRTLQTDGHEAHFTRQEWDLLSILLSHPNRFLSTRDILQLGWKAGYHAGDELRTYVRRLRDKLGALQAPCELLSERGLGYCLSFD